MLALLGLDLPDGHNSTSVRNTLFWRTGFRAARFMAILIYYMFLYDEAGTYSPFGWIGFVKKITGGDLDSLVITFMSSSTFLDQTATRYKQKVIYKFQISICVYSNLWTSKQSCQRFYKIYCQLSLTQSSFTSLLDCLAMCNHNMSINPEDDCYGFKSQMSHS